MDWASRRQLHADVIHPVTETGGHREGAGSERPEGPQMNGGIQKQLANLERQFRTGDESSCQNLRAEILKSGIGFNVGIERHLPGNIKSALVCECAAMVIYSQNSDAVTLLRKKSGIHKQKAGNQNSFLHLRSINLN